MKGRRVESVRWGFGGAVAIGMLDIVCFFYPLTRQNRILW